MNRVDMLVNTLLNKRNRRLALEAKDVEEAVRVMERLRDTGQTYWFRGQIINWPQLTPSIYRESVDFEEARNALNRFSHWAKRTIELGESNQTADSLIAIAQHYGLPTAFIDFTTEPRVAGYFASTSKRPPNMGTQGCIYYLNIEEADDIWGYMPKDRDPIPERITIDVPNLWRLEAQAGVFVWCPYEDLNEPYPIDRIVFPYQGPITSLTDAEMYPERESPLEARLREFFQEEKILQNSETFERIATTVHYPLHIAAELFAEENFIGTPTAHKSWTTDVLAPWRLSRREHWHDVQDSPSITYRIGSIQSIETEVEKFNEYVLNTFVKNPTIRELMVSWNIYIDQFGDKDAGQINKAIQRVWDEMTRLPWNNQNITIALTTTLRLFLWFAHIQRATEYTSYELQRRTIEHLETNPIWIEFGGEGLDYSRAWVEESDLLGAVREDFASLLRPDVHKSILGNSFNTLIGARSPLLLFDFQKLLELFPTQIIPCQAVFYPEYPLYATPTRLHVLGPA